jgi:hypothetical protein
MAGDFSLAGFWRFCDQLKIDTKEGGVQSLKNRLGSQKWVMERIAAGLDDDIHNFVILKCRQAGITTISLALDLYWVFKHQGMNGTLVTHDEPSRDLFRSTLQMYYDGLDREYKRPIIQHNRNQMVFKNGSRLQYQVAGTRAKGTLGRGKAVAFAHSTEVSSWGDEEGLNAFIDSFADKNPRRLYLWETTARGFNHFYDMWNDAKRAVSQRAIFVSWWAVDHYRAQVDSDIYKVYWGKSGKVTPTERAWVREVKAHYGIEIDAEQMAWWRWTLAEKKGSDELMMMQEYPPTEDHAFVATGSQFFSAQRLSQEFRRIKQEKKPRCFRIDIKNTFTDTELVICPERAATLKVWEEPNPQGVYVLGADPAYGSSDWADRFVISVWRAYADKLVQVAEFCDHELNTYSFAWVMAYLAGAYEPCTVNLEINGPGQAVLNELNNLKKQAYVGGVHSREARSLFNVVKNMQSYIYRRVDSMSGSGALHWQTTFNTKERMMNALKDYFERGLLEPRSVDLVDEMKGIVRVGGSAPAAQGRAKDDRVIGAALATVAWNDMLRMRLMQQGATHQRVSESQSITATHHGAQRAVSNYLKNIGFRENR